jgi:sirohydrochlorin cobaltochelatase
MGSRGYLKLGRPSLFAPKVRYNNPYRSSSLPRYCLSSVAYLLVAHGSRDPRPQMALEGLASLVSQRLASEAVASLPHSAIATRPQPPRISVRTAVLECHPLPLHQQIAAIAQDLAPQGYQSLIIMPLFLGLGVHLQEDLPREIDQARPISPLTLTMGTALGEMPDLQSLIAQQLIPDDRIPKILIAHGSRRAGGNIPIETLASHLGMHTAYWSNPHWPSVITDLLSTQPPGLQIIPYVLFAGGITEAIAQQVATWQTTYPHLLWSMGQPLGATPALVQVIAQTLINPHSVLARSR